MHSTAIALGFVCAGLGAAIAVGCSSSGDATIPDLPEFDSGRRESGASDGAIDGDFQGDTAPPGPLCTATPCAIQLAMGGRHSCALLVDGTVRCWGLNVKGQLGSGGLADGGFNATSQSSPVAVAPLSGASQISSNGYTSTFHQTCALAKGAISCWGDATQGHLGGGDAGASDTLPHPVPSAVVGLTSPSRVATGAYVDCAIVSGGSLACWGTNVFNGLGRADGGTFASTPSAVQFPSPSAALDVAPGLQHTCALLQDHTVTCWGANTAGQLARPDAGSGGPIPEVVAGLAGVTNLVSGREFSCAVVPPGVVMCWGVNDYGQLGRGGDAGLASSSAPAPVALPPGAVATQVTAGIAHACALLSDRSVVCWGENESGEVGVPVVDGGSNVRLPTMVPGLANVLEVSAGSSYAPAAAAPIGHTCARIEGGSVKCWGSNADGQLGRGTPVDVLPHSGPALVVF